MNIKAQPGVTIEGKYRLLSPLGAGAMGAVWLADQLSVDRKVAVKLLHPSENQSNGLDARFEVEAKAIARLNHPNCITLYDFGYSEELDSFYTVIEYVKGVVLGKKMGVPMAFNDAVEIVRQVALGLDHAHFHNILHRDLKPDNLMLAHQSDGSELLKILDFGIAKIVNGEFGTDSGDDEIRLTKAGEVFGTPAYMSPEQARSTRELTPASDFYALGVIFYEMIDGRLPFSASTSFDVLMMHVTEEVPRIQREDVPEKIADVIYKLLEKHPYDRFQSGKEIMEALGSETFSNAPLRIPAGNVPTPTHQFAPPSDLTLPPQGALLTHIPTSSKKPYWIVIVLLALLSLGLIAFFRGNGNEPSATDSSSEPIVGKVPISPIGEPQKDDEVPKIELVKTGVEHPVIEKETIVEKEAPKQTPQTTGITEKDIVPKAKKQTVVDKKKKTQKRPTKKIEKPLEKLQLIPDKARSTVKKLGID